MIYQQSIINSFVKKPNTLFLVDSIGAFISAICLLIISRYYSDYFGINHSTFQLLAIFLLYNNIVLLATLFSEITILGLSYFVVELVIIGIIVYVEFYISTKFT